MNESLQVLRDIWEPGLKVKAIIRRPGTTLVILVDEDYASYHEAYHLHRYFAMADHQKSKNTWHISVDLQNGSLEDTYRTLSRLLITSSQWSLELFDFKL